MGLGKTAAFEKGSSGFEIIQKHEFTPAISEYSLDVQWKAQRDWIDYLRKSGDSLPYCYFQGELRSPVASMITLANETNLDWRGITDTPLRVSFDPSDDLLECNARTPQTERRKRFEEDAHNVDFWMLMGHGYGQTGAAFELVARRAIEICRDKFGLRLGVAAMSDMGSEGSMGSQVGPKDIQVEYIKALDQADLAMSTLARRVGFDPKSDEWKEIKMLGLVGHSMWGHFATKYALNRVPRQYPNMVTTAATPVIMGVEPPPPMPAWIDSEMKKRYSKGMWDHVRLLTDKVSVLAEIGVKLGKHPGNDEFRKAILDNLEKYTKFVSRIVVRYIGTKSFGHELLVPIHVDEHVNNFAAVQLQNELLYKMGYITGDMTVASGRRGHKPALQVGIAKNDQTLESFFMKKWTKEMKFPEEGVSRYDHDNRVMEYASGHCPTQEMWDDLLYWQLRKIIQKNNLNPRVGNW